MPRKLLKGPPSPWHSKKLRDDEAADIKTINAWAKELYKWAQVITDEARQFEASQAAAPANHIPDPPPPPFDSGT